MAWNAAPTTARAEILHFNDLPPITELGSYGGFLWSNLYLIPPSGGDGTGDPPRASNVISNGGIFEAFPAAIVSRSGAFTLNSLKLTSARNIALTVTFTGYASDGHIVGTQSVVVSPGGIATVPLNFVNIVRVTIQGSGGTNPFVPEASASSRWFYIDDIDYTRHTDITVTGRVLDRSKERPLGGATASLAGKTFVTGSSGKFTLTHVDLADGSVLSLSAENFLTQTQTISHTSDKVDVGDISLALETDKPVVDWVKPDLAGMYLAGVGLTFTARAQINWNANETHPNVPKNVDFYANGQLVASVPGSGTEFSTVVDVDSEFAASLLPGANTLSVVAVAQDGVQSDPLDSEIIVLPIPEELTSFALGGGTLSLAEGAVSFDIQFPPEPVGKEVTLPLLGRMGAEMKAGATFSYSINSGEWNVTGKAEAEKPEFFLGTFEGASAALELNGKGFATKSTGIRLDSVTLSPSFAIEGEFPLGSYGLLDLCGPGVTTALARVPGLAKALKPISIQIVLKPSLAGAGTLQLYPDVTIQQATLQGALALEAVYEGKILDQGVKCYVGGKPAVNFEVTTPRGDLFKNITFEAYAGLEVDLWGYEYENEYVFLDFAYPGGTAAASTEGGNVLQAADNRTATWRPRSRPWRQRGSGMELFLPAPPPDGETPAQRDFRLMAAAPPPLADTEQGGAPTVGSIPSQPAMPAQAELPLLANVFPDSAPTLAEHNGRLMLLYLRDSGVANPVQFTQVAYTTYDGTQWSTPAALSSVSNGQFTPQVVFDGHGDAIAVWEQVNDHTFTGDDPALMGARMEILTSRWSSQTGTWSAPVALTSNAFLDHRPQLAGPLSNGDVILTWVENQAGLLQGEGAPGAATNSRVMTCRWNAATHGWTPPAPLVAGLAAELSFSLAAGHETAVLTWSKDLDGDLEDLFDTELFAQVYDAATGLWGSAVQLTDNFVPDTNVRAAVSTDGTVYLAWQQDTWLMLDQNFAGIPQVVRPDAGSLGFSDFDLAVNTAGQVMVLWQQMNEAGSDAWYRVYDPLADAWGLDTALSADSDIERSFASLWDAAGNLVLAYNNIATSTAPRVVAVEGGGTVTIEDVPTAGEASLHLVRRRLVQDLSIIPGSMRSLTGATNHLPGASAVITARVRNHGDLAVENAEVAFYDGDPQAGGVLIETQVLPGWLQASEERDVFVMWEVPLPAVARTIHVLIDPNAQVSEIHEDNNSGSLPLNGPDLKVSYRESSVLQDGSARVIATVTNLGVATAAACEFRLWPLSSPGPQPLATATLDAPAPGTSLELALELPPGSVATASAGYRLSLEGAALAGDMVPSNNDALFSLSLDQTPRIDVFEGLTTATEQERLDDVGLFSFAPTPVGSSSTRTFTLHNGGSATLANLATNATGSADFSLTQPALTSLAPGSGTTFTATFTPASEGADSGLLRVLSNDTRQSPFEIRVAGRGYMPITSWRQQYFGSTANAGPGADLNDHDKDGLPNLLEWACRLNPTTSNTLPAAAQRTGGSLEYTYSRNISALDAGATFAVEWSATLAAADWSTVGVTETIVSDNGVVQQVTATVPLSGSTRRFVHLKVTAPP